MNPLPLHHIMKMLFGIAKCTGGVGEHVGKFASMKTNTWCTLYSHVSNVLPQIYEDGTAFCS